MLTPMLKFRLRASKNWKAKADAHVIDLGQYRAVILLQRQSGTMPVNVRRPATTPLTGRYTPVTVHWIPRPKSSSFGVSTESQPPSALGGRIRVPVGHHRTLARVGSELVFITVIIGLWLRTSSRQFSNEEKKRK